MMKSRLVLAALALVLNTDVLAKEVTFGGQLRPRFEFRDVSSGSYDSFTSMRTRLRMTAELEQEVSVLIELQDVRLWGEETNTLGDFRADNFDLHQAYVHFKRIRDSSLAMRVGRQAISFGGQRLVGAVEWTQQGRVFDGIRATGNPVWGQVDVIGIRLADATAATVTNSAWLTGVYATAGSGSAKLDLYTLYNKVAGGVDTDQVTLGLRAHGSRAGTGYRVEGSFQTGTRAAVDVSAFMLGARIGRKMGKGSLTLWYDYLSGDDDAADGKARVFDTLFATNHKFYGFADVFLNVPVHTGGLGLQDIAVKATYAAAESVTLAAHLHAFRSAKQEAVSGSSRMGEEIDLTVTHKYSANVSVVGGFSYVLANDVLKGIGRLSDDLAFGYLMTNVSF